MVDPISDMLIRIKNAQLVSHQRVALPYSKIKYEIAKVLKKEGFVGDIETSGKKNRKSIELGLKYEKNRPRIISLRRVSRPGQRIYVKKGDLRPVRQGYGISIVSTSQGVMSGKEARKKGLGGELICEVY